MAVAGMESTFSFLPVESRKDALFYCKQDKLI